MNIIKFIEAEIELLLGKIPKEVTQYADQALAVTDAIKQFLSNPTVDLVISLIPGSWAEDVKSIVLNAISEALPLIVIVDDCKDQTDITQMVICWANQLKGMPQGAVDGLLQQLAMYITYFLDGQKESKSTYALITQLQYTISKES
jgi:hypothetical protein